MLRAVLLLLAASLVAAGPAAAQVPDSILQALDYLPLQVGNRWQYRYSDPSLTFVETRTVIGDTLMPNGRRYAILRSTSSLGHISHEYLRPDSTDGVVYRYDPFHAHQFGLPAAEMPRFMPVAFFGRREVEADLFRMQCSGAGVVEVLGVATESNSCYWQLSLTWQESINPAKGIGSYHISMYAQDFIWSYALRWFDVNGHSSGTYVAVERERPASYALATIHPNPATDQVAIRLPMSRPGPVDVVVFDMIGRRVLAKRVAWAEPDGEIVLDVGLLVPGIYIGLGVPDGGLAPSSFRFVKR